MWLPQTDETEEEKETDASSQTWKIDWQTGRVGGRIDRREALAQSIILRLRTELGQYWIYSRRYGLAWEEKTGDLRQVLARRISECLAEEERIIGISDFSCTADGDSCQLSFTACTVWGNTEIELEI